MNALERTLRTNQHNRLTPELIDGILRAVEVPPDSVFSSVALREADLPRLGDARLLTDDRERVGAWVAQRIGMHAPWGGMAAIGLLDGQGELAAGCVLTGITATNAFAHVACVGKHAFRRVFFYAVFDYAFRQLGLERLSAHVDADNAPALAFDLHLGFEVETVLARGNGGDVIQLVLWKDRCRWLREVERDGR